jgi:hypothetical protein
MAIRQDLIDAIEGVLTSAAGIGYTQPSETNDIYENFVWTLCLNAARREGARVRYETVRGAVPRMLRFRTAPGAIFSTAHNYTHAVLEFLGCPRLEVHVGARVIGKSRILHECDVAVLYRDEAELCRQERVYPRASRVIVAVECKFYTSALQLHLARGFLGLTKDIYPKERYFVTNAHSDSVKRLIAHHDAEWECGVIPNNKEAEDLLHSFSRAFRNFKIRA